MEASLQHTSMQHIGNHGIRLVRFLSDMSLADVEFSQHNFSERVGRLIDIGDSMRLSALHDSIKVIKVDPNPKSSINASESLKKEVLRVRQLLMKSIAKSFTEPEGAHRIKLPIFNNGMSQQQLTTFDPYHHFYLSHQREFELKIKTLQRRVRDRLCDISTELAQLATLDEAVRDSMLQQTRKHLSVIPKLLGKRFDCMWQANQAQTVSHEAERLVEENPEQATAG